MLHLRSRGFNVKPMFFKFGTKIPFCLDKFAGQNNTIQYLILTPVFEECPPPNILVCEVSRSTLGKIPPNLLEISYGKINILGNVKLIWSTYSLLI